MLLRESAMLQVYRALLRSFANARNIPAGFRPMRELMRSSCGSLPARDVTLHFHGEIVGSDRRPQFLVRNMAKCNIFQPSLILNTIYRFCMQCALYKKSNLIY